MDKIVAVYKCDVFSLTEVEPGVPRGRKTCVFLVNDPDAGILFCIFVADGRAPVGRTVVHKDHFQIRIGLCKDAVYTGAQIVFYTVYRYDHADERVVHVGDSCLKMCGWRLLQILQQPMYGKGYCKKYYIMPQEPYQQNLAEFPSRPLQTAPNCVSIPMVMNLNTPKRSDGESRFVPHGKERSFTG